MDSLIGSALLVVAAWVIGTITHHWSFKDRAKTRVRSWLATWSGGKDGYVDHLGCWVQLIGLLFGPLFLFVEAVTPIENVFFSGHDSWGSTVGVVLLSAASALLTQYIIRRARSRD